MSIVFVYTCGETMPESYCSREFLVTFGGPKVTMINDVIADIFEPKDENRPCALALLITSDLLTFQPTPNPDLEHLDQDWPLPRGEFLK